MVLTYHLKMYQNKTLKGNTSWYRHEGADVHPLFIPIRFAIAEVERDMISTDTDVLALKDRWVHIVDFA